MEELQANTISEVTGLEEEHDKYLRMYADFENYKRNKEKEIAKLRSTDGKDTILKMLPFFDDLERMFDNSDTSENPIYSNYYKMLLDIDLTPIGCVEEPFDSNIHNAVIVTTDGEVPSGFVSKVLKNGYKYKGEIIRFADVAVEK